MTTRVAVIGIGDMGAEMVPHLVETDFEIVAYDKVPERLQLAKDAGAKVAGSVAEAATNADVVLQLTMSDDIPDVLLGEQGALAVAKQGAIVVVTSTTTPQMLTRVIEAAPAGVDVVDAPIVGGVRYAREKSVTFLLGGSEELATKLDPVLSVLGIIRYVGKSGSGVAYKLITNVAIMAAEAGLREALDLADELDMDYELSLDLMSVGPMAAVVSRALDTSNPRPLRRSAEDDDTLLAAVSDPERILPISVAARGRLWEAVHAKEGFDPDFVDLTRKTTARDN